MNNNGSILLYSLMVGLVIIIVALALAPVVMNETNRARNASSGDTSGLDCSNSSISDYDKATCTATDLTGFYFVAGLIFIGGSVIVARIVFG